MRQVKPLNPFTDQEASDATIYGPINFNTQPILDAYLMQLIPKAGLECVKDRIVAGRNGGLAFLLGLDNQNVPTNFGVHDFPSIPNYRTNQALLSDMNYHDLMVEYVFKAEQLAKGYSCQLVKIQNGIIPTKTIDRSTHFENGIYAIASTSIIGRECIDSFLHFIETIQPELNPRYQHLVKMADNL